ncbi:DEAD/DEAH box helicase [Sulfurimonas sp.]|jgi:superfamily II DNA or RNA helicase|uniref:DEAD/DEAH box helicase n=1 Tax=Sulfurimonas sp. TaxID=2022749 RepID=UPI0025CC3821|nr:DEAD/DEAH box helicase [Sulfurimonas sp.]MBT5934394.1 DEAD/DEAH box helicase [Sulfurimonas sp.]
MSKSNKSYTPGQRVIIRDTEWTIRKVDILADDGYELTCDGVSNFVKGKEAIFLTTYEKEIQVVDPLETKFIIDKSSGFTKSLLYMESLLKDVVPTDNKIHRANKAAMDTVSYQFEPALQALNQPRQRILMADAVGLGKTLEAGILATELIKRGKGKRILVLAVKSMLTQFQKEFWNRFSIPLTRLDSQGIQRVRNKIPANMNPFFYYDKSIISIDTLKQEALYRSYIEESYWDIIIIDEAHNVADRNSGSQKSKLAKLISSRCDTLMMLSATPHDGSAKSFASLLNMLDPTAISNSNDYSIDDFKDKGLVIRRFKKDIADQVSDEFKTREIFTIKSNASIAEEAVFEFISTISFKSIDNKKRKASELFKTTLTKSLLSSPIACIESIKNRIKKIEKLEDDYSDDIDTLELLLEKLEDIDENSFSKYNELVNLIQKQMKWKKATDDRIVIFTERIKTLEFLKEHLQRDLKLNDKAIVTMTGSTMSDIEINKVVEDFGQENSKVRLLIATDVASEGINLHYLSHRLIHFDIPWSLMTFQQRNGRVDRYGQEQNPEIYYMQTLSQDEEFKGDNRILEILIKKDEQAAENIGDPSAFLNVYDVNEEEKIVAEAMVNGKDAEQFSKELDDNAGEAEFDFLSSLNETEDEGSSTTSTKEELIEALSFYEDDLKYTSNALRFLQESQTIDVRYEEDRIELFASELEDLKYRFKMLPREVIPENWHFELTNDIDVINQEIKNSRKDESAWPNIHYLWEQHPLLEWIKDKLLSNFDRLQAPVLKLTTLGADELIYIISGLIPNKKAQPMINEWVGVKFKNNSFDSILTLDEVFEQTQITTKKFPNSANDYELSSIEQNLSEAIEEAKKHIQKQRDAFDDVMSTKVLEQLEELEKLKIRHLGQLEIDFNQESKRLEKQRDIDKIFKDYHNWIKDSMEIENEPFIQVISVLKGSES